MIRAAKDSLGHVGATFVQITTYGDLCLASVFVALALLGIASLIVPRLRRRLAEATIDRENLVFAAVASILASIGTFVFLGLLKFPLQDRYYLPLLGVIALSITTIAAALRRSIGARVFTLLASIVLTVGYFRHAADHTKLRLTNCDPAATAVAKSAKRDDLIVLTRFAFGITFQRYYRCDIPWHSVPHISDYSLFRWDFVKDVMT